MLEEFEVLYERLIHEVNNELKGVVNCVQKHTYELDVPNPWECFVKTYEYVYQGFVLNFDESISPRGVRCSKRVSNAHKCTKICISVLIYSDQ